MKSTRLHGLLGLPLALSISLGLISVPTSAQAVVPADYDNLRVRYYDWLTGGPSFSTTDPVVTPYITKINTRAQALWSTMNTASSGRTYIWSDQAYSSAAPSNFAYVQTTVERLREMTLALHTRGGTLYGNAALKANIISALDWINLWWYYSGYTTPSGSNWYIWQLGVPRALVDMTVMLYSDLTSTQISNYMNAVNYFKPNVTAADASNRAWEITVILMRGAVVKDGGKIAAAKAAMSVLYQNQTAMNQNGFFADGSSIEHNKYSYSAGYGLATFGSVANFIYWLKGSPWELTDPSITNAVIWALTAYMPLIYRSAMVESTAGRYISWQDNRDQIAGGGAIEAMLGLLDLASPSQQAALKTQIKGWILNDVPSLDFYANASIHSTLKAAAIVSDPSVSASAGQTLYKQYPIMDRMVAQRPGYLFGVSMFSTRTGNYESILNENLKGWHTGDGMTYLYLGSDVTQYDNNYWPTVDSYRLAGTTILRGTTSPALSTGTQPFAGGTELGGQFGVTGMQYASPGRTLTAKKSWFVFDNEIVALGADITSTDGITVDTIVDNRKLNSTGNNAVTVNGTVKSTTLGWSETAANVSWIELEGNTADSNVGYYFPTPATVDLLRDNRTGTWSSINASQSSASVSNKYFSMSVNHGTNPTGQSYAYAIVPGWDATGMAYYSTHPHFSVLANNADVQAVKENNLNIIGANFWSDAVHGVTVNSNYVNFITSDRKSSVMTRDVANQFSISVSDPTQAGTTPINIEVKRPATGVISVDPGVTVTQLTPTIKISVDPTGARGSTFHLVLSY